MHKSKGLQADYVLILGMFSARLPSVLFSERARGRSVDATRFIAKGSSAGRGGATTVLRSAHACQTPSSTAHSRGAPSKYVTELLRDHRCDGAVVKIH